MTEFVGAEKPSLEELAHFGTKGMKWGVRKERKAAAQNLTEVNKDLANRAAARVNNPYVTQQQYSKLSTKDRVIKEGTVLRRTTKDSSIGSGHTFVSTNEKDAEIYRAILPTRGSQWEKGKISGDNFELVLQTTKNLKSPSEKARIDAYTKLMSAKEVRLATGEMVTGREYLTRIGLGDSVNSLSNHQIVLTHYGRLAGWQGIKDEPLSSAYFKNLSQKGYNALVDDNDRNLISKDPLLIFNAHGSLKTLEVRRLSNEEILKAQAVVKLTD
jgi:hypothetical protein